MQTRNMATEPVVGVELYRESESELTGTMTSIVKSSSNFAIPSFHPLNCNQCRWLLFFATFMLLPILVLRFSFSPSEVFGFLRSADINLRNYELNSMSYNH